MALVGTGQIDNTEGDLMPHVFQDFFKTLI